MTQRIVIIGAGAAGRELLDVIEAMNSAPVERSSPPVEVLGFLDDGHPDDEVLKPYGVEHIGPVNYLAELPKDVGYVIGVGMPASRRALDVYGDARPCPVLVHPTATLSRAVRLGPGTVVYSHASIMNHVTTGRHVHVSLNSTVGHDVTLGDYVTLSPQVAIGGNVQAEPCAFFGIGSRVNPGIRIRERAVVGAGAAVISDVDEGTTVMGVPARRLKTSPPPVG